MCKNCVGSRQSQGNLCQLKKHYFLAGAVPSVENLLLANPTYVQNLHLGSGPTI